MAADTIITFKDTKIIPVLKMSEFHKIVLNLNEYEQNKVQTHIKELNKANEVYIIQTLKKCDVGLIFIYDIDTKNKNAGIDGFVFDYKDNRFLKQAIGYLLKTLFEDKNFNKVYAFVANEYLEYKPIWDCMRFVDEGLMRNHLLTNGKYQHLLIKSIMKHEYDRFYYNKKNEDILYC